MLNKGRTKTAQVANAFTDCLKSMRSNFQFPLRWNFPQRHREQLKPGRHTTHVQKAMDTAFCREDVFVDTHGTVGRPVVCIGSIPCITPGHDVWSVELGRYLTGIDFLNGQGLWESAWSPAVYSKIVENDSFAQSLAGNSFSSTVCQAVLISSFVCCFDSWSTLEQGNVHRSAGPGCPAVALGRVRQKRKAPEFDLVPLPAPARQRCRKGKSYKRKRPGQDSRQGTGKGGKKRVASIWDKEHLHRP